MVSGGVPAGASKPNQVDTSYPATPASDTVGTSGKLVERVALVTAIARSLPDCTCGTAVAVLLKKTSVYPPIVSVSAGPVPL